MCHKSCRGSRQRILFLKKISSVDNFHIVSLSIIGFVQMVDTCQKSTFELNIATEIDADTGLVETY